MITIRHLSARRRSLFGGLGAHEVTFPSDQPRGASTTPSLVATPMLIASEEAMNLPMLQQPRIVDRVRRVAEEQAYGSGSPGGANAGAPGGDDTQTAFFILEAEGDVVPSTTEFEYPLRDSEGNLIDPNARVESLAPGVAAQGTFLKTWGPPLAAVAAIGIAVWILRS